MVTNPRPKTTEKTWARTISVGEAPINREEAQVVAGRWSVAHNQGGFVGAATRQCLLAGALLAVACPYPTEHRRRAVGGRRRKRYIECSTRRRGKLRAYGLTNLRQFDIL